MYYVLVLALAVGASAEVPDYVGAYTNGYDASKLLLQRLDFVTPSAEQLSYAVLKNAISGIADLELLLNLPYDQLYVKGALLTQALARSVPGLVGELAKQRNALAKQKTKQLRLLIEEKCLLRPYAQNKPANCNKDVHELVLNSSELQEEAKLLLALGDLGSLYLELDPALLAVATNLKDTKYLATAGKENLREIIGQTLETYKLLYLL